MIDIAVGFGCCVVIPYGNANAFFTSFKLSNGTLLPFHNISGHTLLTFLPSQTTTK